MKYTGEAAESRIDRDLSDGCMVIVIDTELEAAGGFSTIWGRYHRHLISYCLNLFFQFHHTQMDGAHIGRFLAEFKRTIDGLK